MILRRILWKENWCILIPLAQHKIQKTGIGKQDDHLKPSGYFTFHQVYNYKILHGAHVPFVCFVQSSKKKKKKRFVPYMELRD